MWVQSLGQEDLLEEGVAPTPVFLLGNPMDRGAWRAIIHGGHKRFKHDLVTKQERSFLKIIFICTYYFGYTEKI